MAEAACEYADQEDYFWDCKGRTVLFDYDGLSQQVLAVRQSPYFYTPGGWTQVGDDYFWSYVYGPTGLAIQTYENENNDLSDNQRHFMMPDVHGGNVVGLYQPPDLEDPREPAFQQFEAFGNAMTPRAAATTGLYGWRGQEGSESESLSTAEGTSFGTPHLVLMQARHYDPTIGRFLQADPLRLSSFTTQGLNRYIYCSNDPVNFSDQTGLTAIALGIALAPLLLAAVYALMLTLALYGLFVTMDALLLQNESVTCDLSPKLTGDLAEAAAALGLSRQQIGKAIEKIKRAVGLRGNQNVLIDTITGDVLYGGENIGNVYDE